jgi:Kef-type K+ transport system membrane component KefB
MQLFPNWIIILIAIIVLSRLAALVGRRFGISAVTTQLLTGILLGPSLLNLAGFPIILGTWGSPSPDSLHTILKILAEIGLIQLMFLAGLRVDWIQLKRMGKPSFSVGVWGFILTAVGVAIISREFTDRWAEALAMGSIMGASSFGISIYQMGEMKLLGSQAGSVIPGAAAVSCLLAILLMIASLALNYGTLFGGFKALIAVSWFLGKLIMFFAIAYFLISRFLKLAGKNQKRPWQTLIGSLLLVAAIYAWAAMHFGSFAAVGVASLGGVLLGMSTPGLKEKIEEGFQSVLSSLPIGILFVVLGMEADFRAIGMNLLFFAVLLGMVIGAKFLGSWIAMHKNSDLARERFLIIVGTLPQGEMGILLAAYLFSRGLVTPYQFNIAILVVVMLTMLTSILIKGTSRIVGEEGEG